MLKKIKYFLILAIKKPHLIFPFIYKKHLGLIISMPIKSIGLNSSANIKVVKSESVNEIEKFYKRMNRNSIGRTKIKLWLNNQFDCFLVYYNEYIVIGSMWIFKRRFTLHNTSGRTLSKNKEIKLDNDALYGGNVIIDQEFRGQGINQYLLQSVIQYYAKGNRYNKLLVITGATNGAYIKSTFKVRGVLIGITQVRNILGIKFRKELYLDKKNKIWNN